MKKRVVLLVLFSIIIISGCNGSDKIDNIPEEVIDDEVIDSNMPVPGENIDEMIIEEVKEEFKWEYGGAAIPGKYADADIVDLGNGKYRMYYSAEPEIAGFKGQVYSALSSDGVNWDNENGERIDEATFPSVIKLPDNRYRMYFQNQGLIKSAISDDGLSWKRESGNRIDTSNNAGLTLDSVLAPTVIKNGDEYIIVYAGAINEEYPEKVPNNDIHLFLWATSKDGLNFEKKGIALDSRNDRFKGWLDGAEFTRWDDGSLHLYFWGYKGIYHIEFDNSKFSQNAVLDFTTATDPNMMFPQDPPGDPTLAKINNKWFMYYGQHEKGIYYATLE